MLQTPHQTPGIFEPPASGGAGGLTGFEEVILHITTQLDAGVAINIQTGAPAATVEGTATLTLPADYNTNTNTQVILDGNELYKAGDTTRLSATQISFTDKLKVGTILKVRNGI